MIHLLYPGNSRTVKIETKGEETKQETADIELVKFYIRNSTLCNVFTKETLLENIPDCSGIIFYGNQLMFLEIKTLRTYESWSNLPILKLLENEKFWSISLTPVERIECYE